LKTTNENPKNKVWQKLRKNPLAIIGGGIICLAILISIFSYPIMPDNTPSANNGALELRKKPVGFSCQILAIRKQEPQKETSFISSFFNGTPSQYFIRGIENITIDTNTLQVRYSLLGTQNTLQEKIDIPSALFYIKNIEFKNQSYKIETVEGEVLNFTKSELIQTFYSKALSKTTFYLGTDNAGRDFLSRLILGTRISLGIGFASVIISLFVGLSLGAIAGYFRGWQDKIISWFITVIWSIPGIMLVIALSMAFQSKGVWVAFVSVGLTTWVETARIVRGQVLEIREHLYIEAVKALGIPEFQIITKHILPNILGPLVVIAVSNFSSAILIEAGLSFLGLGVQPPTPSWGLMVNEGYKLMTNPDSLHLMFYPGLFISLLVLAFNILGNALRDAFDAKM